ncbi:MAG: DUF6794 domain-containing protein [Bacteroidota bacterium]
MIQRVGFPILAFLFLTLSLGAQKPPETKEEFEKAYQRRIRQETLYGVYIPKDLTEAFTELNRLIDEESKESFKSMPEDAAVDLLFFSFGRWITHNWGFYGGSRLSHYIKQLGVTYPEDMSEFIVRTYHRNLNRSPLDVKTLVEEIQARRQSAIDAKKHQGTILYEETRTREKN